jgi:O-antigen/teichoic acid export membrane protein
MSNFNTLPGMHHVASVAPFKERHVRIPIAHFSSVTVLLVTTFGSALLVFLTQLILVRLLSIAEYGQLVALLAVINLMTPLSTYGVGWFWLQAFGEEGWKAFRWLRPSVRVLMLACTVATLILATYTWCRFDEANRWLATTLAIPVLLGQVFAETTSARLQLEECFIALAVWQSLTQTGRFAVSALLLAVGLQEGLAPLAGYAALGALLAVVGLMSLNQMSHGVIALRGHGSPPAFMQSVAPVPTSLRVFQEATPYCLWTVFYLLYFQSVIILLAVLVGKPAAAVYNVAFQVMTAAYLVPNVIYSKYLFGKVFRWSEHDVAKFYAVFHVGVIAMTVLGLASMVVVIVMSPVLVPVLFGAAYAGAVPILTALSVTIPTRFLQSAYSSLFFSKKNMIWQVAYSGIAALFCVSVNVVLLPYYGLKGAVIAQLATEFFLLGLYIWGGMQLNKEIRLWHSFRPTTFQLALKTLVAAPAE